MEKLRVPELRDEISLSRSIDLAVACQPFKSDDRRACRFPQINLLKSSACRDRSTLILATGALHPSGISCNNIPKSRNDWRTIQRLVNQGQRTTIIFNGYKTCQRNCARVSSGSPPGSLYYRRSALLDRA